MMIRTIQANSKSILILLVLAGFIQSCGDAEVIGEDRVEESEESDTLIDPFYDPDFTHGCGQSPLQVASIFKKSNIAFYPEAPFNVELIPEFEDSLQRMLIFGVCAADLAYTVMDEKMEEARVYMQAIRDLAPEIGMEQVFDDESLYQRFEDNIENKDSIEILMIDMHERHEEYLDNKDLQHTSAIYFAGAWSEGMYLGVYDYEANPDKEGVGAQLTEQMAILGNIIKGLKDESNHQFDLDWLIEDMENIQSTFDGFQSVYEFYEDETADELELTEEETSVLGDLIKELRRRIVGY